MLRWLATAVLLGLLALDLALPHTPVGRRGSEARLRAEADHAVLRPGVPLPALSLRTLEGAPLDLSSFRGRRLLLTFERSVDW